ncbi:MAG: hypothetical protein AB4290_29455 [Spirulina sp.]
MIKFNPMIRNLLRTGILSLAGVALLTQVTSAGEIGWETGSAEDLQGVSACNVEEHVGLFYAELSVPDFPPEAWTCKDGRGFNPPDPDPPVIRLEEETIDEILYIIDRHNHPDALIIHTP